MLMQTLLWTIALCAAPGDSTPFQLRVLYAPGHFGNTYECAGENEMRALLAESKEWGFNTYADWFDTVDCSDPFETRFYDRSDALWDLKKAHFRSAQSLGLACDLILTPNHVFLDQCRPDWLAVQKDRIFGQLVCPSIPEARQVILHNYENLFSDLAKAGVTLRALWSCPYDYGGCACDKCNPWILTFARLTRDIYTIAEKYHPGIEMRFIGWWWSDEEHKLFAEWADQEAPGWAKSIALHIPYGAEDVSNVPLPQGCERQAFVHIGYAESPEDKDIYGQLGPEIAAGRLQRTFAGLAAHGCTGVMAYSEGDWDDVNRALFAGLSSGRYATPEDVLAAYATRYFNATPETAPQWVQWLEQWGHPYAADAAAACAAFPQLAANSDKTSWRLRQWELKAQLMACNQRIMRETEWTQERLDSVEKFWATKEILVRDVWRTGPLRAIFARPSSDMPWFKEWNDFQKSSKGNHP